MLPVRMAYMEIISLKFPFVGTCEGFVHIMKNSIWDRDIYVPGHCFSAEKLLCHSWDIVSVEHGCLPLVHFLSSTTMQRYRLYRDICQCRVKRQSLLRGCIFCSATWTWQSVDSQKVCATVKGADELYIFICYTMSIVIGQCTVVFETRRTHDQADPSLLFLSLAGKQQHVVIHAVRLVVFI